MENLNEVLNGKYGKSNYRLEANSATDEERQAMEDLLKGYR